MSEETKLVLTAFSRCKLIQYTWIWFSLICSTSLSTSSLSTCGRSCNVIEKSPALYRFSLSSLVMNLPHISDFFDFFLLPIFVSILVCVWAGGIFLTYKNVNFCLKQLKKLILIFIFKFCLFFFGSLKCMFNRIHIIM